jgi:topoisomerase-4 subunit B
MRLEPVRMKKDDAINGYLEFFMGKNTPERQEYIIHNLKVDEDKVEEETNVF